MTDTPNRNLADGKKPDHVWYMFFKRLAVGFNDLVNDMTNVISLANDKQYANIANGAGGWEDLRFPATVVNPVGSTGAPTYDETNVGLLFSATVDQRGDVVAQLPHGWNRGSNIRPHVHWRPLTNIGGNVEWQLQYAWSPTLGQQPTWTITNTVSNISNATGDQTLRERITGLGNITPPVGALESSICKFQLLRLGSNTADTHATAVLMDEFDIHYYNEKSGTDPEYPV